MIKQVKQVLAIAFVFAFVNTIAEQKTKNEDNYKITEFRIDNSSITVSGGNVVFSDNSTFNMSVQITGNVSTINTVALELIGKDIKGNPWIVSAPAKYNATSGYFEATTKVNAKFDNPFLAGETNCEVVNIYGDKKSTSQVIKPTCLKTNFAILLNGSASPSACGGECWSFSKSGDTSSDPLNFVNLGDLYMTKSYEFGNSKLINGVVWGVVAKKGNKPNFIDRLIQWGEVNATANITLTDAKGGVVTVMSKSSNKGLVGQYSFDDSYGLDRSTLKVTGIQLVITNSCKETFKLNARYKQDQSAGSTDSNQLTEIWTLDQRAKDKECKTQPKVNKVNVVCDFAVDRGICLFNGQKPVLISTDIDAATTALEQVSLEISVADCKGNKKVFNSTSYFNGLTGEYDAIFSLPPTKDCMWSLLDITVNAKTSCGGLLSYTQSALLNAPFKSFELMLNGTKRPAKYGQCMIFSKVSGSDDQIVKIDDLSVTQTYTENKETNTAIFGVVLGLNNTKKEVDTPISLLESILTWGEATLSATIIIEDENGKTETKTAKYNSEGGLHFITDRFAAGHIRSPRIKQIDLQIINTCADIFNLQTEYKSGYDETAKTWTEVWDIQQKTQEECGTNYQFANASNVNVPNEKTTLSMAFSIALMAKSDIPESMNIIAEISNCKNEVKYISIAMTVDPKTGEWIGAEGFLQSQDCPWSLVGVKGLLVNTCGDKVLINSSVGELKYKAGMNIFVAKLNFKTTSEN